MISVEGISKSYGGQLLFRDLSWLALRCDVLAVAGGFLLLAGAGADVLSASAFAQASEGEEPTATNTLAGGEWVGKALHVGECEDTRLLCYWCFIADGDAAYQEALRDEEMRSLKGATDEQLERL